MARNPSSSLQDLVGTLNQQLPSDFASLLVHNLGQFVPGYSFITAIIRHKLGVDADRALAVLGFFFGGWAVFKYVKNAVLPKILQSFTSRLIIDSDDKVYDDFNKWLLTKRVFHISQSIKLFDNKAYLDNLNSARHLVNVHRDLLLNQANGMHRHGSTVIGGHIELDNHDEEVGDEIYNGKAADAVKPLQFEPCSVTRWFFHRGRLFLLSKPQSSIKTSPIGIPSADSITIYSLGFSTKPLKNLIQEIRAERHHDRVVCTNMFRHNRGGWQKLASRLSRPLHTVVLDKAQKSLIVKDANDFLQPAGARWYAAHGIPYRRGYLFSGPPGTGKSSVSYALAGLLGLDIYIMPLAEGKVNDFDIENLFSTLPNRCIVLLEDIDCAGIRRVPKVVHEKAEFPAGGIRVNDQARVHDQERSRRHRSTVTLSTLLNAIDGVAAPEGRILIMTTNKPDALDDALKRPGRVDLHIRFPLASREDIREIFNRMYTHETKAFHMATSADPLKARPTVQDVCRDSNEMAIDLNSPHMTLDELQAISTRFAECFPESCFSPAEVQGYLLMHRNSPTEAVGQVGEWVSKQLSSKQAALLAKEEKAKKAEQAGEDGKAITNSSEEENEKPTEGEEGTQQMFRGGSYDSDSSALSGSSGTTATSALTSERSWDGEYGEHGCTTDCQDESDYE